MADARSPLAYQVAPRPSSRRISRARGSNEPENSLQRAKELDHFIREARAFELDHGHAVGAAFDRELSSFRHTLEAMLGSNDVGIAEDEGGR